MKKIVLGAVVLLILALVCAPFINGLVFEKIVTRAQGDINAMYAESGSDVRLEIIDYDRGFSSTDIEWRLDLGSLAAVYGIDEIIVRDRAEHGVTGVVSTTSLEKNPWFADLVDRKLDGRNPLRIITTYPVFGSIESVIDLEAFSVSVEDQTVDVRPARVVTEIDRQFNHFISKADWDGLSVEDTVQLDDFSMDYDLEKISTYIWEGDVSWRIAKIAMQEEDEVVELTGLEGEYSLETGEAGETLSAGGVINIADLVAGEKAVRDGRVRLEVNNIDARGYEEFMELYSRTVYSLLDDINAAKTDPARLEQVMREEMATVSLQFMAAYEKLLKKGLEIKVAGLQAEVPEGDITGNLAIKLNRDMTFAQLTPIVMQPGLAFDIFSLHSNLSFPAVLAGDNPALVAPFYPGMQTGLFIRQGADLVHSARGENGKLMLNGAEVLFN